jgi:alpha-glucoside transport system substrate-binding protein
MPQAAPLGEGVAAMRAGHRHESHRFLAVLLISTLLGLASCSGASGGSSTSVSVLGSWTGSEGDAFQAVVRPFEERTGIRVDYTTTRDLHGAIEDGLASGHPPDLAGLDGPTHLRELAGRGKLKDLGGAIDLQQYKESVAPTFVEFGSVNGQLLGVFLKATLKGLIWYDPAVFRRGIPASFEDLQWMADRYLADDTHEWCVGLASEEASGWPGTDIIESFLIQQSGVDAYDRWISGDLPWTSAEVRSAFLAYGQVVADDAVHGGASAALSTPFQDAGYPLFTDPPGCLFLQQGSFMPAFFEADGQRPGVTFDFFPFPDINPDNHGNVIGGGDLFGMLTDNPAAAELLRYLVSPEAQTILVSAGGALSVDKRVGTYPNELVQREASLLTGARRFRFDASDLMPAAVNKAFWAAVLAYTADQTRLDEILQEMDRVRGQNRG